MDFSFILSNASIYLWEKVFPDAVNIPLESPLLQLNPQKQHLISV